MNMWLLESVSITSDVPLLASLGALTLALPPITVVDFPFDPVVGGPAVVVVLVEMYSVRFVVGVIVSIVVEVAVVDVHVVLVVVVVVVL